jgi:hypothetical protein
MAHLFRQCEALIAASQLRRWSQTISFILFFSPLATIRLGVRD